MLCGEDPDSDTDAHIDLHGGGSANSNTAGACDVERRQLDTREDDDALPSVASGDGGLTSCADSTADDGASVSKPLPLDTFQMSAGEAASIRAAMSTFDLPAPEWARGLDVSLSQYSASTHTWDTTIETAREDLPGACENAMSVPLVFTCELALGFGRTGIICRALSFSRRHRRFVSRNISPDPHPCSRPIHPAQNATLLEQVGSVLQQHSTR